MGRGVSCGGGQSSLGYLFGNSGGETDNSTQPPAENSSEDATTEPEPSETSLEPSDDNNNNTETKSLLKTRLLNLIV